MRTRKLGTHRVFVLDTNVLIHDPGSLFRFQEHDVYLPMVVLEELDGAKKGVSEVARNVRQVSRALDELLEDHGDRDIEQGIPLPAPRGRAAGRLFFQTRSASHELPDSLPGNTPDNGILNTLVALEGQRRDATVILVTKDINLRIKARVLGYHAEDYTDDKVLEDVDLLYTGLAPYPEGFWEGKADIAESWQDNGRTFYRLRGPAARAWHPNQCLYSENEPRFDAIVRGVDGEGAVIELRRDYASPRNTVWGINARNREQNFAINLLMDPEVDFVSLLGTAGTGKTLLALAAGLAQTLEGKRFREIVMTRVTVPVGDDIGCSEPVKESPAVARRFLGASGKARGCTKSRA
jgi:PhoH-like ATPase